MKSILLQMVYKTKVFIPSKLYNEFEIDIGKTELQALFLTINLEWKGTAVTSLEPLSTLLFPAASSHLTFPPPRSTIGTDINLNIGVKVIIFMLQPHPISPSLLPAQPMAQIST